MKDEHGEYRRRYRMAANRGEVIVAAQGQDPMGRLQFATKRVLESDGFAVTPMGSEMNEMWASEIMPSWVEHFNAIAVVLIIGYQTKDAVNPTNLVMKMKSECDVNIIILDIGQTAPPLSWAVADFATESTDELLQYVSGLLD